MELVISRAAQRRLRRMSPKLRAARAARLKAIAEQPFAAQCSVAQIKGEQDVFRLRQRDRRALSRIAR